MAEYTEKITTDMKEAEVLEIATNWFKQSETYHDRLLQFQKIAEEYYTGNQTDKMEVPGYLSNVVENRVFEAVETLVPITTANAHRFVALPPNDDEKSKDRALKMQKVLERKYDELMIQEKLEDVTRHVLLFRFGVMQYFWDEEKDDIGVDVVDPRHIYMPKVGCEPHNIPYVMRQRFYSKETMEDKFPDVKIEDLTPISMDSKNEEQRGKYTVYEVWTNEVCAWFDAKFTIVLKIEDNPNWDWEGTDVRYIDRSRQSQIGAVIRKTKRFYNHLDNPEKPFVFFTIFRVRNDEPIGSVSLIEIGIPLQDAINMQKRGIINNLKQMGNSRTLVDNDAMPQEESDNITNEPGITIRGEGVASQNKVRFESGTPIPQGHFVNLQHSEAIFDNIVGTHSATRGNAAGKTLGQDLISRQQDYTRADLITRMHNRGIRRLANGLVQLMKLKYTQDHVFKILGESGAVEFVNMDRTEIDDYVEIDVKDGNTLPMDPVSLRTEAVQMWQLGAIDPVTLFERLNFPNPAKSAERLALWKSGQLDMETQSKIQTMRAQSELGIKENMVDTALNPPVAPGAKGGEGQGRGTETPMNVLQRAKANLGGGAPTLPGIPNQ